ncbi:MerR family transcriptional regulator [Rhizobium sp. P38BS-XIX]|uniref:MerR family transcriptional regulator n=1 Tax=Rhizobium sp. P38BS-XIX TaxID=2726740 RepID=UPI0014566C38|nr:MerR family transcriptional regulator [Rhizobium sp. P38BS-XIX]NLR97679.1 MerR family transcriptional regulator [Rhizobium sp. P38BS-XIX]
MSGCTQDDVLITALECAERIGITIRALRIYEQHGLISPRRTSKQWRLYGRDEIARLNEILALKSLGFSLRDIAKLLRKHPTDLAQMLALQRNGLEDTRRRAERGLQVIEALQSKVRSGAVASLDDLTTLARETNMTEPSKDLRAWKQYEQMRPRTEVAADSASFADYAGAYTTEDGTISIVSSRDDKLFYRIVGQEDIEISSEGNDGFFMKSIPVQVTFNRNKDGHVVSLTHHQNGCEDLVARMDLTQALGIEKDITERIRDQTPMPDGPRILQRVIEEHARGEPDTSMMSPPLAALASEQMDMISGELEKAGSLTRLIFKGVANGLDIYEVEFENAKMEWGIAITFRGKISHLYLRPIF